MTMKVTYIIMKFSQNVEIFFWSNARQVHSAHGGDFYQDPAFLTGGYFPELDAHKLLLTDVMEMYPQPDKSPNNSVDTNR